MGDSPLPGNQEERPNPELAATYDYKLPRRLVVCLDGTWNKRDSGTSVYHLSNLVQEGRVRDDKTGQEWFQLIYYDEGVGTGILDGITGGAFGIGLSENIREAYDWLVEKYREGDSSRPDDEIYVFGFSRGSFTARSLIGLIAKCGLLHRGAPIPPAQLWNAYRILGRHENPKTKSKPSENWWEQIVGRARKPFHLIRGLKRDKWEDPKADPPIEAPLYRTEQLLLHWSRRVKINCVGIFDTVGSMGLDALAIPWLRDKIAQFHDTYLTSLIVNGFHALAIDEHRANFSHIPWHQPATLPTNNTPGGGVVEQRWFIGAHSNVGGGYDDGMLSQYPLAWMVEKCAPLGLQFRKPLEGAPDSTKAPRLIPAGSYPAYPPLLQQIKGKSEMANQLPQVRDSFADIAAGIWQGIIRSKRHYRRIAPLMEFQNGVAARSANESVHESVPQLLDADYRSPGKYARYNPPNLWEYWERTKKFPDPLPSRYEKPKHRYLENTRSWFWFFGWWLGVGAAAAAVARLAHSDKPFFFWPAIAMVIAFLIDWRESAMNHAVALEPDGMRAERRKALVMLALFFRLIIFGAIVFGISYWIVKVWPWLLLRKEPGHLWHLLLLDGLLIYCGATAAWCAAPMLEAGFGSIVGLQFQRTAAGVFKWLNDWGSKAQNLVEQRQLLMPVAHTIFRDMFAYIPAYAITLYLGNRFAYWCLAQHVTLGKGFLGTVVQHWPAWSLYAVVACALADYLEDGMHLSYLKKYPQPPSAPAVFVAFSSTMIKMGLLLITSFGFLTALGCMGWDQLVRIWAGQSGGLSVLAVLLTAALLFPPAKDCVSWLSEKIKAPFTKKPGTAGN